MSGYPPLPPPPPGADEPTPHRHDWIPAGIVGVTDQGAFWLSAGGSTKAVAVIAICRSCDDGIRISQINRDLLKVPT